MVEVFCCSLSMEGFLHEGGAVDAIGELFVLGKLGIEAPDEGLPIGTDEIELPHGGAELWVMPGECEDVGVRGLNGVGTVSGEASLGYPGDGRAVVGDGDGVA